MFLLMLTAIILLSVTRQALADPPPITGGYSITATVPGNPPTIGATITDPVSGADFTAATQTVTGTCAAGTIVKLTKNGVIAGSTICDISSHFSLQISLFPGLNDLIATNYNFGNLPGPVTPTVIVSYALPVTPTAAPPPVTDSGATSVDTSAVTSSATAPSAPGFYIDSAAIYRSAYTGETVHWPFVIAGGVAPFAVSVDWGDGRTDLYSRSEPGTFDIDHTYTKSGPQGNSYAVKVLVRDKVGHQITAQFVSYIHNRNTALAVTADAGGTPASKLLVAWPMWGIAFGMVPIFWLGETWVKWRAGKAATAIAASKVV